MEIGKPERIIVVEPAEDPFELPVPPEPERSPLPDPSPVREPAPVPVGPPAERW